MRVHSRALVIRSLEVILSSLRLDTETTRILREQLAHERNMKHKERS